MGPLIPLFWTSGDVCSGFQRHSLVFLFFSRNLFNITVLDDLAKQKPAWQSSMYEYNPASNAVDGKRLTTLAEGSCSHTNYEYSPWLTVDLRAKYKVTEVVITNRGDCCCELIFLSCCIYYFLKNETFK